MKIVALGAYSHVNAHSASRILTSLLGLAAAAMLLGACQGSSGRTDQSYWRDMYGDPDTGVLRCCSHAERGSNR